MLGVRQHQQSHNILVNKMKHLRSFQEHNEGIKSGIIGAGLAGSMLLGSPDIKAKEKEPTSQTYKSQQDVEVVYKQIDTLSKMRKSVSKDEKLSAILDEIKMNVYTRDAEKYNELYEKLSEHLENEYGFEFKPEEPKQFSESEISDLKSQKDEMTLFTILGWLGSVSLAICGIPQAWMSYKEKRSEGISWAFLLLWGFGEIFALAYVYDKLDLPLILNYAINILIISVILYYKIKPNAEIEPAIQEPQEEEPTFESVFDFFKSRKEFKSIMKIIEDLLKEDITLLDEVVGKTYQFLDYEITKFNKTDYLFLTKDNQRIGMSQKDLSMIWNEIEGIYQGSI